MSRDWETIIIGTIVAIVIIAVAAVVIIQTNNEIACHRAGYASYTPDGYCHGIRNGSSVSVPIDEVRR